MSARESGLWIRDQAVEVAFALNSKTLLKGKEGLFVSYEIQTGPKRDPLILLENGTLKIGGPIPVTLTRAVISCLDHPKGIVKFIGTNEHGTLAGVEIRSNNPSN